MSTFGMISLALFSMLREPYQESLEEEDDKFQV
jgi:hypothetical protein